MQRSLIALVAAFSFAFLAAPVQAQESPVYIWVNFMKSKPGQSDALAGMIIEDDARILDKLVDSGSAFEWGLAMPVIHDGKDAFTHVEWITFAGYAGADAFMKAFMAQRESMGAEGNKAMAEKYAAVLEAGGHADTILRSLHTGSGKPARPGYIHLSYNQARPGKGGDATAMYKEFVAPVYDKLVASGSVINYGLTTPDVHRGEKWTHLSWFSSVDLAARDVVDAAFDAADAARTPAENEARGKRRMENMDWDGHSDQILVVLHHKLPAAK